MEEQAADESFELKESRASYTGQTQLSDFERDKLEKDAKKNWDLFYKRNGDRFFKARYWTRHEFKELFASPESCQSRSSTKYLLEVGCGCGDFVIPLIEQGSDLTNLFFYCCDISNQAIEILKSKDVYRANHPTRLKAFVADITDSDVCSNLSDELDGNEMDFATLIFVLSAIDPRKMHLALKNIYKIMKPGGLILFRDYAEFDKAMMRFSASSKICDNFYRRQDGTRAYFFSSSFLSKIFDEAGFECKSIEYLDRETLNHATEEKHSRKFLQARFTKKK